MNINKNDYLIRYPMHRGKIDEFAGIERAQSVNTRRTEAKTFGGGSSVLLFGNQSRANI